MVQQVCALVALTVKNAGKNILYIKRRNVMKIAIGNDHTALEMKAAIKAHLEEKGYEVLDLGTNSTDSCDHFQLQFS